jgi:inner membrane protein
VDTITHSLFGFIIAKSAGNTASRFTIPTCILAANAPDIDIVVWPFWGLYPYIHHHRGITHSLIGILGLGLLIPAMFWLLKYIVSWIRKTSIDFNIIFLVRMSLIASASHLVLDWTNNYGIRPWLPWDSSWYFGDLIFIIDPWLWLIFGSSAFLLSSTSKLIKWSWLFGAILIAGFLILTSFKGTIRSPKLVPFLWITGMILVTIIQHKVRVKEWRRTIAVGSFITFIIYLIVLSIVHHMAFKQSKFIANSLAHNNGEHIERIVVQPMFANPTDWECLAETNQATYRFKVSLNKSSQLNTDPIIQYKKPVGSIAAIVNQASENWRAKIFLGFARFPVVVVNETLEGKYLVEFADLRFARPEAKRGYILKLTIPEN